MSIFTVHSFGLFNIWLLMALYVLPILLTIIYNKHIFSPTSSRFSLLRNSRQYNLFIISKFLMLFYFLYAIVLPINLDSISSIIGLFVYTIGFAAYSSTWITIAVSGGGKVFSQGPFRFSRHPVYFSSAVLFIGAGLVSNSWFFLGFSILVGLTHMYNAQSEEQICLEVFGDDYRKYMSKTPKWFGLPSSR